MAEEAEELADNQEGGVEDKEDGSHDEADMNSRKHRQQDRSSEENEEDEENLRHERLRAELDELDRVEDELKKKLATLNNQSVEKRRDRTAAEGDLTPKRSIQKPTQRDRKMFGLLVGTLQQAKKDWKQSSDLQKKRSQSENRAREREEEERRVLVEKQKRIREIKLKKTAELNKLRDKKQELQKLLAEQRRVRNLISTADRFIKTKAEPKLLWRPRTHNDKTKAVLEAGRKDLLGDAEEQLERLRKDIVKCKTDLDEAREHLSDIRKKSENTPEGESEENAPKVEGSVAATKDQRDGKGKTEPVERSKQTKEERRISSEKRKQPEGTDGESKRGDEARSVIRPAGSSEQSIEQSSKRRKGLSPTREEKNMSESKAEEQTAGESLPEEALKKDETLEKNEAPEKGETSEKVKTSEKVERAAKDGTSERGETPEKDGTSERGETPEKDEISKKGEIPIMGESPERVVTPGEGNIPEKGESVAKQGENQTASSAMEVGIAETNREEENIENGADNEGDIDYEKKVPIGEGHPANASMETVPKDGEQPTNLTAQSKLDSEAVVSTPEKALDPEAPDHPSDQKLPTKDDETKHSNATKASESKQKENGTSEGKVPEEQVKGDSTAVEKQEPTGDSFHGNPEEAGGGAGQLENSQGAPQNESSILEDGANVQKEEKNEPTAQAMGKPVNQRWKQQLKDFSYQCQAEKYADLKYADLESWTVKKLRAELGQLGVKHFRIKHKKALIEALRKEVGIGE